MKIEDYTVYPESVCFRTPEEAQAECDRRNGK